MVMERERAMKHKFFMLGTPFNKHDVSIV